MRLTLPKKSKVVLESSAFLMAGVLLGLRLPELLISLKSLPVAGRWIILGALVIHLVLCIYLWHDLSTRSLRPNKSVWVMIILMFPVLNMLLYTSTMKRNRGVY